MNFTIKQWFLAVDIPSAFLHRVYLALNLNLTVENDPYVYGE